ncbi:hypothetical protein DID88_005915 [Monilinia fructigena]|uniref:Apple domain-containing protein n=1 Tax=Monilinia fructigena TaxID=38457 RepID=A0A395J2C4_9HELO|nr:hypothetical protein DID88_005915 [Monilinia fructigena]
MLIHDLGKLLLPLAILTGQVFAVDPTPAEKAKWDAVCKQKAGPQFSMQFNAAGQPTGNALLLLLRTVIGAHTLTQKPTSQDAVEKIRPNPNPTCPKGDGRIFTMGGKKWKLYCKLINHGTNDIDIAPAANMGECMTRCAGISNCVRAIFNEATGICYLRSHGNNAVPVTVDPYDSAHLVDEPVCPLQKDFKECMEQCSAKAQPYCQGVNFYDDGNPTDNCVWASVYQSPPTGAAPPGGDFLCAIPTTKKI